MASKRKPVSTPDIKVKQRRGLPRNMAFRVVYLNQNCDQSADEEDLHTTSKPSISWRSSSHVFKIPSIHWTNVYPASTVYFDIHRRPNHTGGLVVRSPYDSARFTDSCWRSAGEPRVNISGIFTHGLITPVTYQESFNKNKRNKCRQFVLVSTEFSRLFCISCPLSDDNFKGSIKVERGFVELARIT